MCGSCAMSASGGVKTTRLLGTPHGYSEKVVEDVTKAVFKKPAHVSELGETVREIVEEWIGRGEIISAHIWEMG